MVYVFGILLHAKMVILIVNKNKNVSLGFVKMLHLILILIHYVDNLRMIALSIKQIMGVFND